MLHVPRGPCWRGKLPVPSVFAAALGRNRRAHETQFRENGWNQKRMEPHQQGTHYMVSCVSLSVCVVLVGANARGE